MKKIIFGIFAHPDDEAFGPAGALLLETRKGTELHLVTLTAGDAGTNPDSVPNLADVREKEWRDAGRLIGATSMELFGYKDGRLTNQIMIEAAQRIVELVTKTIKNTAADTEIELMTLDLNGYTGHIDHIVAARAACLAFYRLKQSDTRFTRIRFACLPDTLYPTTNTDWIYMEPGRTTHEINETIDARLLQDEILSIMRAHHSQRSDAESAIKSQGANLGLNYFIVKT